MLKLKSASLKTMRVYEVDYALMWSPGLWPKPEEDPKKKKTQSKILVKGQKNGGGK